MSTVATVMSLFLSLIPRFDTLCGYEIHLVVWPNSRYIMGVAIPPCPSSE